MGGGGEGLEGEREIGEGGYEETIICLNPTNLRTCWFTVPPAVALLSYMTIRELAVPQFRRFFPKPGFLTGVSLYSANIARRVSEAAIGGAGGCV